MSKKALQTKHDREKSLRQAETTLRETVLMTSPCRIKKEQIQDNMSLVEDLGLDSFSAAEILVAIEKLLKVRIKRSDVESLVTFSDLRQLVMSKLRPIR